MRSREGVNACLVGLAFLVCGAGQATAQTVELRSVHVAVLEKSERDRFLAAHNAARKAVKVEPVAWSDELGQYASDWLDQQKERLIAKAKEGWAEGRIVLPQHREDYKHGENIAGWGGNRVQSAEWAVTLWLREKAAFDKLNEKGSYKFGDEVGKTVLDAQGQERPVVVGHYTAIVWRTTTHIGAARLTFDLADDQGLVRRYVAVICNYDPAGNRDGEKPF